eukprot:Rhum_TRINITY_DN15437_c0_g1::Rhum_TRINITY_DN15437_c0_g1_i1::g.154974::m.154974
MRGHKETNEFTRGNVHHSYLKLGARLVHRNGGQQRQVGGAQLDAERRGAGHRLAEEGNAPVAHRRAVRELRTSRVADRVRPDALAELLVLADRQAVHLHAGGHLERHRVGAGEAAQLRGGRLEHRRVAVGAVVAPLLVASKVRLREVTLGARGPVDHEVGVGAHGVVVHRHQLLHALRHHLRVVEPAAGPRTRELDVTVGSDEAGRRRLEARVGLRRHEHRTVSLTAACVTAALGRAPDRVARVSRLRTNPPGIVLLIRRPSERNAVRLQLLEQRGDLRLGALRVAAVEPDLGQLAVVRPLLAQVGEDDLRVLVLRHDHLALVRLLLDGHTPHHVQVRVVHHAVVEAGADAVLPARVDELAGDVALAALVRALTDVVRVREVERRERRVRRVQGVAAAVRQRQHCVLHTRRLQRDDPLLHVEVRRVEHVALRQVDVVRLRVPAVALEGDGADAAGLVRAHVVRPHARHLVTHPPHLRCARQRVRRGRHAGGACCEEGPLHRR